MLRAQCVGGEAGGFTVTSPGSEDNMEMRGSQRQQGSSHTGPELECKGENAALRVWAGSGTATPFPGHKRGDLGVLVTPGEEGRAGAQTSAQRLWASPPPRSGASSSFISELRERALNLPPLLLATPLPWFPLPPLSCLSPCTSEPAHFCWIYFCLSFSLSLSTEVCVCLIIGRRDLFFFSFAF